MCLLATEDNSSAEAVYSVKSILMGSPTVPLYSSNISQVLSLSCVSSSTIIFIELQYQVAIIIVSTNLLFL